MTGMTHSAVAVAAYTVVASVAPAVSSGSSSVLSAALAVAGALLPDIDTPGSLANRLLWGAPSTANWKVRVLILGFFGVLAWTAAFWMQAAALEFAHPKTYFDQTTALLFPVFAGTLKVLGSLIFAKAFLDGVVKHRGVMHSLFALVGFGIAAWRLLPGNLWVPFTMGYGLHIGLDMLTPMGVQLLWPRPGMIGAGVVKHRWIEGLILLGALGVIYLCEKGLLR